MSLPVCVFYYSSPNRLRQALKVPGHRREFLCPQHRWTLKGPRTEQKAPLRISQEGPPGWEPPQPLIRPLEEASAPQKWRCNNCAPGTAPGVLDSVLKRWVCPGCSPKQGMSVWETAWAGSWDREAWSLDRDSTPDTQFWIGTEGQRGLHCQGQKERRGGARDQGQALGLCAGRVWVQLIISHLKLANYLSKQNKNKICFSLFVCVCMWEREREKG